MAEQQAPVSGIASEASIIVDGKKQPLYISNIEPQSKFFELVIVFNLQPQERHQRWIDQFHC